MATNSNSGNVSGGTETISLLASFELWGNTFTLEQKTKTVTTVRHGVSLQTAQNELSESNLSDKVVVLTSYNTATGAAATSYVAGKCKGNKKDVTYRQIGDTNLYDLEITVTTLEVRLTTNGNVGGWEG